LNRLFYTALIAALFAVGCNRGTDESVLVAKIGNKELTWDDIRGVVPDGAAPEDSILLAERYIQNWIREQVVLLEAEQMLTEEKKNFNELIENYRKSLLTYAYEQEWVQQKLDTAVTMDEIKQYYLDNIQNFQLRDYILKLKFCAVSADLDARKLKTIRKLFYSRDPADITPWITFCVDYSASYFLDEDRWLTWDEFTKQIPVKIFDRESFLKSSKDVEFEKDNNIYLIRILEYQLSGSQSPLSFEKENIRNMILNRRKLELLGRMREDLYSKAIAQRKIKTYYTAQ